MSLSPDPSRPRLSTPTRRGLLGVGAAGAALLGLAACGSGGKSDSRSTDAKGAGKGSGGKSGGTRTVDTAKGPLEIPDRPQRVVALNDFPMSAMFDLGLTPHAACSTAGEQYVAQRYLDRWRTVPKVSNGVGGAIQVEKVAELRPDLILAIDAQADLPYKQLSELAPTVVLSFNKSRAPWRDVADETAKVLGVPDALDKLKQRYAERTAEIKKNHAAVLGRIRWDLLQGGFDEGQWWLYGHGSPIGGILGDSRRAVRHREHPAGRTAAGLLRVGHLQARRRGRALLLHDQRRQARQPRPEALRPEVLPASWPPPRPSTCSAASSSCPAATRTRWARWTTSRRRCGPSDVTRAGRALAVAVRVSALSRAHAAAAPRSTRPGCGRSPAGRRR